MESQIWGVAGAVLVALGGGGAIVLAMSSWLGKVWANRILQDEKAKYEAQFAVLKSALDKQIHAHNVAASRIDADRAQAIRKLYSALIAWNEAATQIRAPNQPAKKPALEAIENYRIWAQALRDCSVVIEELAMDTALYLSEETYSLVVACGHPASMASIEFCGAVFLDPPPTPERHLERVEQARINFDTEYQARFEPARRALLGEFRKIINPTISVDG